MTARPDIDRPRPWAFWPLRLVATLQTLAMANQPVFAGQLLAGTFSGLTRHRENAMLVFFVLVLELVTAVVLRVPGGGPVWPVFFCLGMLALVAIQMMLGFTRTLALHVPLGVTLVVATVLMLVWAWRRRPGDWWPGWTGGPA